MLKLFKYEMIQSWRNFMFVFFGYLVLCLLVPLSNKIDINENLQAILILLFTCMIFGICIGVFLTVARNFKSSMFGHSGYLTLTLPVNTHELLAAKILSSLVWVLLSGFVLLMGMILMILVIADFSEFMRLIPEMFSELGKFFMKNGWDIIQMLITTISSILCFVLVIYFGLACSHTSFIRNHRTFWAIVIMIVYNIVVSTLTQNISVAHLVDFEHLYSASLWMSIALNLAQSAVLYLGTWYLLENKLEIQ